MAHCIFGFVAKSVAFVTDQSNNHAVEVEEEHQEVEAQLDEGFLLRESWVSSMRNRVAKIAKIAKYKLDRPSCARSACGKSQSHPAGAGSRRSCDLMD
jgi:hypothetical protein